MDACTTAVLSILSNPAAGDQGVHINDVSRGSWQPGGSWGLAGVLTLA